MIRTDPATPSPGDSLVGTLAVPSDIRRRVSRLLLLRTLVITVVLGLSMWLLTASVHPVDGAMWVQSLIIAATYLSSIVFGVLLRRGVAPRAVAAPMHAVDVAVTSLLVYVTGGAQSPYAFLFALSIVSAGAISYRRGAMGVTIASLIALLAVSLAAWGPLVRVPLPSGLAPWEQTAFDFARTIGIQAAALVGVGALAFIFGDQLQRGAETLATTRKAAADLYNLHQDIVRSLASGLITISADGSTVLTVNQVGADILRKPVREIVGRSIEGAMPGLSAAIAHGKGELRRADIVCGELTVGVTVSPLRDVRDVVIGRIVNFQDLTELRRLEQHMRRAERLATVGQLAAGIAHEIRNPLASISGSIELLRQTPISDDDRVLMNIVHREVQRLNELIGDLLDYANPRPSQHVDFDAGVMVRETIAVARGDQAFAAVELASDVDEPLAIHADASKLRQVLWNLLRNAADAAMGGGKHVRVDARAEGANVVITVIDDGPGIPAEQLARIFDPFFTTKKKGTGLGLATCHAVIAEHGGRIDVDSTVGTGTKMAVSLPARR
ncbi:MAG: hypothetical protein KF773_18145 [Deltaproteobacteria bacterium]|nr:hypothetical protein [Deltaproteobacteria bacterium]MCW5804199.1 hypothetical protein [Deltaproteobacteria bacterium]